MNTARRNERMIRSYEQGQTMQEIADVHGISRERVRQILSDSGTARRAPSESSEMSFGVWANKYGDRVHKQFDKTLSIKRTIAHFDGVYPKAWVARLLYPRSSEQRRSRTEAVGMTYTTEHLLKVLRRHAHDGHLTARRYEQERDPSDPATTTFIIRFGSWSNAIRAAGLTGGSRHSKATRTWTNDEMLEAVAQYVNHERRNDKIPTVSGYHRWRAAYAPTAPAFSTIRLQTNMRWLDLLEAAKHTN